jgi:hypothetical protein
MFRDAAIQALMESRCVSGGCMAEISAQPSPIGVSE